MSNNMVSHSFAEITTPIVALIVIFERGMFMKTILKIAGTIVKWYLKATLWLWAAVGVSYVCKEYVDQHKAGYKPSAMDLDTTILDHAVDNYKELAKL
jgi:hypothetical protein